ncbi:hypothetical protein [Hahella sp. NBU794]|uniref:hypothetical protein n=1 Tax=Hahella sp. NBU794 TaxID=3422590 RepID=UPI003D6DE4CE
MIDNEQIRRQLAAELNEARRNLAAPSEFLAPLVQYFDAQKNADIAAKLALDLLEAFDYWRNPEQWSEPLAPIKAACIEWYYDGSDPPEALGYVYASVKNAMDEDPDFGVRLIDGSCGFELPEACFPLYEFYEARRDDENFPEEEYEAIYQLYERRVFYCLHIALANVTGSESFKALPVDRPFYFYANEHCDSPHLLFILDAETALSEAYELGRSEAIYIDELSDWVSSLTS